MGNKTSKKPKNEKFRRFNNHLNETITELNIEDVIEVVKSCHLRVERLQLGKFAS